MINRNAEASEPAQIGHNLVDIAPAPALGWVVTFDDRVPCRLEVSCCVPIRRLVAAADMAAGPAQARMYHGDLCTVVHCGGDPLDRAAAYVADREDAGQIGSSGPRKLSPVRMKPLS